MKKGMKNLLALLLCPALLCGALAALAEEVEIEFAELNVEPEFQIDYEEMDLNDLDPASIDLDCSLVEETDSEANRTEASTADGLASNSIDYDINDDNVLTYFYADENQPPVHFDIPEGVVAIDENTFNGRNIKSVTIPSSVTTIGSTAFCNTPLESITIPGTVKSVGYDAFRDCKKLKTATIMNGVETLGHYLFMDCTSLESVFIPGSVKVLEYQSFDGCTSLTDVTIEDGVEELGSSLFSRCSSLKSITIPGSVSEIPSNLFYNCYSLEKLILCEGIKTIKDYYAFHGCYSLSELTIPGSMKVIIDKAFSYSPLLSHVTIGEGVETIGAFAFNCHKMTSITIPESVKQIASRAIGFEYSGGGGSDAMKVDDFIIRGEAGTAAENYAKDNGFEFDDGTIKPKSITITKGKSAEIEVDKTLQLKTSLKPSNAKTTLTWKSSNEDIATVSNKGVVKGIGKGKATITVTTANGKSAKITIKVIAKKPSKVTITNGKKATVKVGKTLQLKTKLSPANAETKLTWTSSNKKVATVSSKGVVKGVKAGKAKITVKTANGKSATITITVK